MHSQGAATRYLLALLPFALLGEACGGPPAPVVPATPPAPVASTALPAPSAPPKPALPRAEIPAPLTKEEKAELASAACKPLVDAFQKAVAASKANGRLNTTIDGLTTTLASPPKMAEETAKRCGALFERETRGYVIATLGADARVQLQSLAQLMKVTLAENGKMCPSTTQPMPPQIPAFYTQLSRDVWQVEPWICLLYDTERTSVQLEVQTSRDGATFVARGIPFPKDGNVVEWKLEAKLAGGTLTWDKPEIVK